MNNCNLYQTLILFIVVLAIISNVVVAAQRPVFGIKHYQQQPQDKVEHKRFYSWEEGKRSADEYEHGQHELMKRRAYQPLPPDSWTTYFRL